MWDSPYACIGFSALLLLEGGADGVCRRLGRAGANRDLICGAVRVAIVIFAIADIAANALDVLLITANAAIAAAVHRILGFHKIRLPFHFEMCRAILCMTCLV